MLDSSEELVSSSHNGKVEVFKRGMTEEKPFPVYGVETTAGSHLEGCHDLENDRLNIWAVTSKQHGDMKRMLDALVEYVGTNQLRFTMVVNDNLKEKLHGFEEQQFYWDKLGEEMTVLVGEWKEAGS